MSTGILGKVAVGATTNTEVYSVPSGKTAACTINICNRSAAAIQVRIALSLTTTPATSDFIEYDATIPANGVLERAGIVLGSTEKLIVYASNTGLSAVAWGYEE